MSVGSETPPAGNRVPAAPVAGGPGVGPAVDMHLRVQEKRAAAARRVAAFEAGRHFHRARVGLCDLAFRPDSRAAGRWHGAAARGLLAAAAAMSSPAEGGVRRDLELWLGGLCHGACSGERGEWLAGTQDHLDQMGLGERREFDLVRARNEVVQVYHDAFDAKREEVCGRLPGRLAGVLRLGELVELGALPDAVFAPPVFAVEQAVPAPIVWGFGVQATDRSARDRLLLAPHRRRRFDLPWPTTWPAQVRREWSALGLADPPEGVWPPPLGGREDRAGRRALVNGLAANAARLFGERYEPSLSIHDRLRVINVTAQSVELDGRPIKIRGSRPFTIFQALLNAPSNRMTTDDLLALPHFVNTDVSKELAKLPTGLKGVIVSTGGPNAYYHFLLPDLPDVEGDGLSG